MVIRGQRIRSNPPQHLTKRRTTRHINPQNPRIDEEPHQLRQRLISTTRDRTTDRHILTSTQPRQQHRQRRLHHHRQRRALLCRELGHGVYDGGPQLELDQAPAVARDGRPRAVGGQVQQPRTTVQLAAPVVDLGPGDTASTLVRQQVALPEGIVRVLHRQFSPLRRPVLATRGIGGHEVAHERIRRLTIAGDVVDGENQHMVRFVLPHQQGTNGNLLGQAERDRDLGRHPRGDLLRRNVHHIHVERDLGKGNDPLEGFAYGVFHDSRPKNLVPVDDIADSGSQGRHVDDAVQLQHEGPIVGGRRAFKLVQEPKPTLRERQRNHWIRTPHSYSDARIADQEVRTSHTFGQLVDRALCPLVLICRTGPAWHC